MRWPAGQVSGYLCVCTCVSAHKCREVTRSMLQLQGSMPACAVRRFYNFDIGFTPSAIAGSLPCSSSRSHTSGKTSLDVMCSVLSCSHRSVRTRLLTHTAATCCGGGCNSSNRHSPARSPSGGTNATSSRDSGNRAWETCPVGSSAAVSGGGFVADPRGRGSTVKPARPGYPLMPRPTAFTYASFSVQSFRKRRCRSNGSLRTVQLTSQLSERCCSKATARAAQEH